jgi:hypothetical protein
MECLKNLCQCEKCATDNRRSLRFALSLQAECHFNSGAIAGQCRIVDICVQGLGFEIETDVIMRYGQKILLKIFLPHKPLPLSAVLKLQWIHVPLEGRMIQRVGGRLLFMDVLEKAQLMQHAYTEVLECVTRTDFAVQPSRAFAPGPVF